VGFINLIKKKRTNIKKWPLNQTQFLCIFAKTNAKCICNWINKYTRFLKVVVNLKLIFRNEKDVRDLDQKDVDAFLNSSVSKKNKLNKCFVTFNYKLHWFIWDRV